MVKEQAVGPRGLLVHEGADVNNGYRYFPDNEQSSWRRYGVKLDAILAQRNLNPAKVSAIVESKAPLAKLSEKTFLVNLDAFSGLAEASEAVRKTAGPFQGQKPADGEKVFLLHEHNAYYAVPDRDLHNLEPLDQGEARVLIKRGTIAAALPPNALPIGTHCVLVNLTPLVPNDPGK